MTNASDVLSLGADPEFFFVSTKDGKPVSPHTFIPGTKEKPAPLLGGSSVQLDGMAAEIGIQPAKDHNLFADRLQSAKDQLLRIAPKNVVLSDASSVYFDKEYYDNSVPASSKVLGCTPDRDAYNDGKINPIPAIISDINGVMRTAGGHIHFGWTKDADVTSDDHLNDCIMVIRNIDFLYTFFEPMFDTDEKRRLMYGKPGAFRVKPYGCEYRTPSNAWLKNRLRRIFIYRMCKYAFWAAYNNIDLRDYVRKNYNAVPYDLRQPLPATIEEKIKQRKSIRSEPIPGSNHPAINCILIDTCIPPVHDSDGTYVYPPRWTDGLNVFDGDTLAYKQYAKCSYNMRTSW